MSGGVWEVKKKGTINISLHRLKGKGWYREARDGIGKKGEDARDSGRGDKMGLAGSRFEDMVSEDKRKV